MKSSTTNRPSSEMRGPAVRMVLEHEWNRRSRPAAVISIVGKIGRTCQRLNQQVKKAEVAAGTQRDGVDAALSPTASHCAKL